MDEKFCPEQVTFYPRLGLKVKSWVGHLQVSSYKIPADNINIIITSFKVMNMLKFLMKNLF
jgi:hypothetical protein